MSTENHSMDFEMVSLFKVVSHFLEFNESLTALADGEPVSVNTQHAVGHSMRLPLIFSKMMWLRLGFWIFSWSAIVTSLDTVETLRLSESR